MNSLFLNVSKPEFEKDLFLLQLEPTELRLKKRNTSQIGVFGLKKNSFKLVYIKKDRMIGTIMMPLCVLNCRYHEINNKIKVDYSINKANVLLPLFKTIILCIVCVMMFMIIGQQYIIFDNIATISIVVTLDIIVNYWSLISGFKKLQDYLRKW